MTHQRVTFALLTAIMVYAPSAWPQMGSMTMTPSSKTQAVPSTSLTLTIEGRSTTLSVADLQAMPQKSVTAHNEHTKADETYTGVSLGDLLSKYGFPVDKSTHQKMLHSYLRAEGTDRYWVVYSTTEIESSEHNGDVLVATSLNGGSLGVDGALKLVVSGDKRPERWVRNLAAITLTVIH